MIADLKPYPAMKKSGVLWLGEVPAHWEVRKLKHLTRFQNGLAFNPSDWAQSGVPIIRIQNLNGSNQFNYTTRTDLPRFLLIRHGDLLFSWSGNRGTSFGPFMWTRHFDGYLNQHIFKLYGYSLDRRYFAHVLRAVTRHIEEQTHGIIGLVHVTKPELGAVEIPVAPPAEQAAVIRFLDHADRRIRGYIRAKQKLIKLLEEQKQAIIHRAVTRGLDPNVHLKPSGVEWLGDVPEHWEVRRIQGVFRERKETGQPQLPILIVSIAHGVTMGDEFDEDGRPKRLIQDKGLYKVAHKGDIAYNMMRMWQGAVGVVPEDGLVSPAYVVARPNDQMNAEYFTLLFRTEACKGDTVSRSRGIVDDRNRLYWDGFKDLRVPVPPYNEQNLIVALVVGQTKAISKSIQRVNREICLLREYRTRLIADVVTGKLDVREAAARLPDEVEETETADEIEERTEGEEEIGDGDLKGDTEEAEA